MSMRFAAACETDNVEINGTLMAARNVILVLADVTVRGGMTSASR